IADGHHRYETALQYAREHGPEPSQPSAERNPGFPALPPRPESAAMMTFVNMDRDGLVILPTHRVVHDLDGFDPARFLESVRSYFTVESLTQRSPEALVAALKGSPAKNAFIAITNSGKYLLTANPEPTNALHSLSERQRSLDTVQLHAIVLQRILGISPEDISRQ